MYGIFIYIRKKACSLSTYRDPGSGTSQTARTFFRPSWLGCSPMIHPTGRCVWKPWDSFKMSFHLHGFRTIYAMTQKITLSTPQKWISQCYRYPCTYASSQMLCFLNEFLLTPLVPKTMKNEDFRPQNMGEITPKNEGFMGSLGSLKPAIAILWLSASWYVIRSCSRYNCQCSCRSLVLMPVPSSYRSAKIVLIWVFHMTHVVGWLSYSYIYMWNLCIYGRCWCLHKGCFSCLFNFCSIFCQRPSHLLISFPVAYCFWTEQYLESMFLSRLLNRDPYNGYNQGF